MQYLIGTIAGFAIVDSLANIGTTGHHWLAQLALGLGLSTLALIVHLLIKKGY